MPDENTALHMVTGIDERNQPAFLYLDDDELAEAQRGKIIYFCGDCGVYHPTIQYVVDLLK